MSTHDSDMPDELDEKMNKAVDELIALGYMTEDSKGLAVTRRGLDYITLLIGEWVNKEREKGIIHITSEYTIDMASSDFTKQLLEAYGNTQSALVGLYMEMGSNRPGSA